MWVHMADVKTEKLKNFENTSKSIPTLTKALFSPPVQFYFKNTSKLYFLMRNLNNILFNPCYSVIAQCKNLKYLFTAKESQYIPDFQLT